jgi:hypothetical protein
MIWNDLARTVIGMGAPLIGSALAGPLGGAAGKLLADALGASAPTASAVHDALQSGADSAQVAEAVQKAEAEWAEAIATIARTQLAETGATMRAEAASGDVLQRWWRPLYALELSLVECPAFALTLLHALWTGHDAGVNGFANLSGLLIAYFAARFGVLGVYVSGRTREKQAAATGEAVPGLVAEVVKAVRGRK